MGQRTREVQLGEHTYTVVAQRHAYLERKLGPEVSEVLKLAGGDTASLIASGSEGYHRLLGIFIPDLMALFEWRGFPSQTAFDQTKLWKESGGDEGEDQYDESQDKSPDLDQMVDAMQAVAEVNRIDLVGKIKELAGPDFFSSDLWKALKARVEIEAIQRLTTLDGGSSSESLPPPSGEPQPANGGTTRPTAGSSAAGPSPASSTT